MHLQHSHIASPQEPVKFRYSHLSSAKKKSAKNSKIFQNFPKFSKIFQNSYVDFDDIRILQKPLIYFNKASLESSLNLEHLPACSSQLTQRGPRF